MIVIVINSLGYTIKPVLAPLLWPQIDMAPKMAYNLTPNQILAWSHKLAWPKVWPLNTFFELNQNYFFIQNFD